MVLRGTYGEKIHRTFRVTRQGVRWRFQRIFNDIYVAAFATILLIEKTFGTQLRDHAIQISRERYALRQEMMCGRLETKALAVNGVGLKRDKKRERDECAQSGERR